MRNTLKHLLRLYLYAQTSCLLICSHALAVAPAYTDGELSGRDTFYKLMTGGFGSLVIVFMGLGGLASLLMTRQGRAGKNAPVLGIIMLLIAAAAFGLRIMIQSGMLGHEYLEWV